MTIQRENRTVLAKPHDNSRELPVINVQVRSKNHSNSATTVIPIQVLDINSNGMGISCEALLEVGQKVLFLENDFEWDLPEKGVVMWTYKDQNSFRAGIQFILP